MRNLKGLNIGVLPYDNGFTVLPAILTLTSGGYFLPHSVVLDSQFCCCLFQTFIDNKKSLFLNYHYFEIQFPILPLI
jgi:hypothetical protein